MSMFEDDEFHENHGDDFADAEEAARRRHPSASSNPAIICYRKPKKGKSVDEWEVIPFAEYEGMIVSINVDTVDEEVFLYPAKSLDDEFIFLNVGFDENEPWEDMVTSDQLVNNSQTIVRKCKLYSPERPWGQIIDFKKWYKK